MELIALMNGYAIYKSATGLTVAEPIEQDARDVLEWHARNIPVNDR